MLDRHLHPRIKPLLHQCVRVLDKPGITPDGLTLVGFAIGVLALPFLALGWYLAALVVILLNRLLDGLDGALARRRGGLPTRAAFSIFLSIFFFTRWCRLVLFLLHRSKMPRQAAGCCLRLSVRAAVFSPLLHWQRNIRLITPVMHISRFTIWGINRRQRDDFAVCSKLPLSDLFSVVCVDLRCVVLDDNLYAGVEWVSDAEVAPASVIAMLFAAVRAAFTGCNRIFGSLLHSYQPPS